MSNQSVFAAQKIALIGVPSSAGARLIGQELGPQSLRTAGLAEALHTAGHEVVDLGDVPKVSFSPDTANPKQQNLKAVVGVVEQVANAVDLAVENRTWPLVIGGDCTITIGVLAALIRHFPKLGMAYVDGDVDLNTPETTHSGIFDGMVLAHIIGKGADQLSHFGARYPLLEEQNIALFGYSEQAGGLDPVEIELLLDTKMAKYPMEDIRGQARVAASRALTKLETDAEHILVHFDVDVIDFDEFPAVDVPHRPGLSLLDVQEALSIFLGSSKVVGLVVTEFNAACDSDGKLARKLISVIQGAVAETGQ